MKTVTLIECDNPRCDAQDHPEDGGRTVKGKLIAPYGWIQLSGQIVGRGAVKDITVCSADCLAPAMKSMIKLMEAQG